MEKFKANVTYSTKSICDQNCTFKFKVVKRTAKSVWIIGGQVKEATRKAISVYEGREEIFPLGKYSMAPVLRA